MSQPSNPVETEQVLSDKDLLSQLKILIERDSFVDVEQILKDQGPAERTRLLSRLSLEEKQSLLTHVELDQAADLLHEMPELQAVRLLKNIDPAQAAQILKELPRDEQADFVGELPAESMDAILSQMNDAAALALRKLTDYDDEVAGGIMIVEFLAFREQKTVGDVIEFMRSRVNELTDFSVQYVYVVDGSDKLLGVLRLRDLLLSPNETQISEIMITNPVSVTVSTKLQKLHAFFVEHSYIGLPVVDEREVLVGVLRRGDVEEAMAEHFADDFRKAQGIVSEEIRTMPLMLRSRRRLAWLSINILLNIAAASVIAFYQETLTQVIALAVFLPIISDMSGCSGNQAVAVSMRELSLGLVNPNEVLRVWFKELSVGLINGLALGVLISLVAYLWKGNPWLGGVVGIAMMANTVIAVSLGGTLPLIMRWFKLDPALASGPILTTVTDMCGFFLVLGSASMFLEYLT
ncbi:MAG: magnesium transporter [Mariniblastus sp.]